MKKVFLYAAVVLCCVAQARVERVSFFGLLPPRDTLVDGTLVRGSLAVHPEWYGKEPGGRLDGRDDKVHARQLCPWNGGLRIELTRVVLDRCAAIKHGTIVLRQEDTPGTLCECKGCLEMGTKYASPAGSYFEYLANELGPLAAELYPGVTLVFRAQRAEQTLRPPKGLAFPDKIAVEVVSGDPSDRDAWKGVVRVWVDEKKNGSGK